MKDFGRSAGLSLLAVALAMTVGSCGSSGDGGTQPRTPVRTVIGSQNFSLAFNEAAPFDITITGSGSGTMDATADWTFGSNDVDLYVTTTGCASAGNLLVSCSILTKADSTTAKPERITLAVTGGSVYRIWVANFGPGRESGTLVVGLTQ